jgi:PAS domain S-box-containing protein
MSELERDLEPLLKEAEARLRAALDSVGDGAWDWNVRSGEVFFSDAWIASLGFERREVRPVVAFWEALIHPDDAPRVAAELERHFSGETDVFHCDYRIRTGSGAYRRTLDRGRVIERGADGAPLRMVGTNCDIEDQARTEADRRELAALHHSILQTAGCVVLCLDREHRILEFNAAAEALYGVRRDAAIGLDYLERFLPAQVRASVASDIASVLAGAETRNFLNPVIASDGSERVLSWNVTRRIDAAGGVCGIVAIGQDVTERERAREELRVLRGLLPICAGCKRVRIDSSYWTEIDEYLEDHTDFSISHGLCPICRNALSKLQEVAEPPVAAAPPRKRVGFDHLLLGPPEGRVLSADIALDAMLLIRSRPDLAERVESAESAEEFWRDFLQAYDAVELGKRKRS